MAARQAKPEGETKGANVDAPVPVLSERGAKLKPHQVAILEAYARGDKVADIATLHGYSVAGVHGLAHKSGVPWGGQGRKRAPRHPDRDAILIGLRESGLKYEAIAAEMGITKQRVYQILCAAGRHDLRGHRGRPKRAAA